jgi:hypothetical protein
VKLLAPRLLGHLLTEDHRVGVADVHSIPNQILTSLEKPKLL